MSNLTLGIHFRQNMSIVGKTVKFFDTKSKRTTQTGIILDKYVSSKEVYFHYPWEASFDGYKSCKAFISADYYLIETKHKELYHVLPEDITEIL